MPTFICLLNWTDQGAKTAKDAGKRYQASKVLAEKLGGKLLTSYIATGQYDVIATLDMPDGQVMAKFAIALSASGPASNSYQTSNGTVPNPHQNPPRTHSMDHALGSTPQDAKFNFLNAKRARDTYAPARAGLLCGRGLL
jgi:uncharacterized protein with GYD domain